MLHSLPVSHWSEDLDIARSAPLAAMRRLAEGRAVTVVGALADELAVELGTGIVASARLPAATRPVLGSAVGGSASGRVLIVLDAALALFLMRHPKYLTDLAIENPGGLLLPFRMQRVLCNPSWGRGFSWIEHTDENAWVWCEAPGEAIAHLELYSTAPEPLPVLIEFEAGCIYDNPVEVTLAADGLDLDTAQSGNWRSLPFTLQPGATRLVWRSSALPRQLPGFARALSFLIKNFRLQGEDDVAVLSVAQAYELATTDNDPLAQEPLLRRHLHAAGCVSIAGVMRSGTNSFRHRPLPLTVGSPDFAVPCDAETRRVYGGVETHIGDIAWLLASTAAGVGQTRRTVEIIHAV